MADDAHICMAVVTILLVLIDLHRRRRKRALAALLAYERSEPGGVLASSDEDDEPPAKRARQVFERRDYNESEWMQMLQDPELHDPESKAAEDFRDDYRVPYPLFAELVAMAKRGEWFPMRDDERDVAGRQCIPVELKVRNGRCTWRSTVLLYCCTEICFVTVAIAWPLVELCARLWSIRCICATTARVEIRGSDYAPRPRAFCFAERSAVHVPPCDDALAHSRCP